MGPGARGLHGVTAAEHVVVVYHLPVVTVTAPGQPLGSSPNSEVTLNLSSPTSSVSTVYCSFQANHWRQVLPG